MMGMATATIPETVRRRARIALARRDFWTFCQVLAPDFYKADRTYLHDLCDALQAFLTGPERVLVVNAPPRHGKSRTVELLVEWAFGQDRTRKIMTASYNETLAQRFSRDVRDAIQTRKADDATTVYSDIFPSVQIQQGDAAVGIWALEGQHVSYVATSPGGTATGLGADIMIIDDLIKNEYEARSDRTKLAQWLWFTGTMLQRLEHGKLIVIMTRWATDDFAGRILQRYAKDTAWPLRHTCLRAVQDDGTMLCPEILSRTDYDSMKDSIGTEITEANYQQSPIDLRGRLYTELLTYEDIPRDAAGRPLFTAIKSYTDTADTGADSLCHICYGVYQGLAYVLDVLFTTEPMEKTEPSTALSIHRAGVREARIESNNGGLGFSRRVREHLERMGSTCTVIPFTQKKNKRARILSEATTVMNRVRFPVDWEARWPDFARALLRYQREGHNAHDDAPDALTGVVEWMQPAGVRGVRGAL